MTDSAAATTAAGAEPMITAILAAESHHEALGLCSEKLVPAAVRTAFRRRALICHPDKVRATAPAESARAEAAFRRIAVAFDALHEPKAGSTTEPRAKRRRHANSSAGQGGRSEEEHGEEASWDEWERDLRRFEDLERWFVGLQSARYADRHTRRLLEKAAKTVTELDERAGVADNPELIAIDSELADGGYTGCNDGCETQPELHLANLLLYMREQHKYCFFCATRFEDLEDLERTCPGLTEADHAQAAEELTGDYDY